MGGHEWQQQRQVLGNERGVAFANGCAVDWRRVGSPAEILLRRAKVRWRCVRNTSAVSLGVSYTGDCAVLVALAACTHMLVPPSEGAL